MQRMKNLVTSIFPYSIFRLYAVRTFMCCIGVGKSVLTDGGHCLIFYIIFHNIHWFQAMIIPATPNIEKGEFYWHLTFYCCCSARNPMHLWNFVLTPGYQYFQNSTVDFNIVWQFEQLNNTLNKSTEVQTPMFDKLCKTFMKLCCHSFTFIVVKQSKYFV